MEMNNTTGSHTGAGASGPSVLETFENLYPSLLQCFTIILLGYCTARLGYISPTASKGISVFVSLMALPALLFKSMVQLDFSRVNWPFLNSILIGKAVVFFTVMLFTLVLVRPTNLGKAGIYAIFSVQSNDLALGYPLLKAIYKNIHPEYVDYIYLFAPVTLVCLNPIGFFLMEIHKQHNTSNTISKFKVVITTLKGVVTNPIVFMTFIGILGNFLFHQKVPAILKNILDSLGQAFLATSLFYLGVKMVGNMTTQMGHGLKLPLLLIAAKILLLPLITRELIQVFQVGSSSNDTDCWSMFGFLYGTFPTAPTVPIFAAKFGIEEEAMTSSMVMCTFLSAPVMFISAQMSVLPFMSQAKISSFLENAMLDVSSVSIPFGVWVVVMFCLARRYRVYPHNFTLCLVVCQLLVCFSAVLSLIECYSEYWFITESILFFVGRWGSFSWTAMVAVGLYLVRCRGDQEVSRFKWWIILFGWGLPFCMCGIAITLVDYKQYMESDPGSFFLHKIMTSMPVEICSLVVAFVCLVITVFSLVGLHRGDRYCKCPRKYECASKQGGNLQSSQQGKHQERCGRCIEREQQIESRNTYFSCCDLEDQVPANYSRSGLFDIESLDESTCLIKNQKRTLDTEEAAAITTVQSDEMDANMEEYFQGQKHQLGRHVTMLLILLITMILALFIYFLSALQETRFTGILIALTTANSFFVFGQSFVVFACFGLEKQLVIIPFLKRWRKLWYGAEEVHLPKMENLDPDVIHLCDQFNRYHKEQCQRLLVSDKRYRLRMYKSVFRGDELVNWLLEVGLATDRPAAVQYGHSLILGRVIRHVTEAHFFYDSAYLYQFC